MPKSKTKPIKRRRVGFKEKADGFQEKKIQSKQRRALEKLCQGFSIKAACRSIPLSRKTFYQWAREDADFKAAVDDAIEEGTDELEDVATKRAKKRSDVLLMFLLNGRRPEKYKRKIEHTGDATRPIVIQQQLPGDSDL